MFFAPIRIRLQSVPSMKVETKKIPKPTLEASSPKGRGQRWTNYQLVPTSTLVLTSYLVSHNTLHTSCAIFCFCHWEEISARWSPLAEDTLLKSSRTDCTRKRRSFQVNSILSFRHNDKHETQHVGQLIRIKGHNI